MTYLTKAEIDCKEEGRDPLSRTPEEFNRDKRLAESDVFDEEYLKAVAKYRVASGRF